MPDTTAKRARMIEHLEDALALSKEIADPMTGYLIQPALDEARSNGPATPTA